MRIYFPAFGLKMSRSFLLSNPAEPKRRVNHKAIFTSQTTNKSIPSSNTASKLSSELYLGALILKESIDKTSDCGAFCKYQDDRHKQYDQHNGG